ncbi:MAG TPA: hypothetical protein PLN52_22670 [Opitutaceae bacterium]|nr:hypothetical protein [Opitutaceae bacterium]
MNLTDAEKQALLRDMRRMGRPNMLAYLDAQLRGCAERYGDHPTVSKFNALKRERYTAAREFIDGQYVPFPTPNERTS